MSLLDRPLQRPLPPTATDWTIVAPWYRWERRDGLEPERAANAHRPAIHKYGSTEFVAQFLDDPQRSLAFDSDVDVHQRVEVVNNPVDVKGREKRLTGKTKVATDTRKLFLAAHQRFYVVSAGLHCARPGFPKVDPESVTEVGFVVRRKRVPVLDAQQGAAAELLRNIALARVESHAQLTYVGARERAKTLHPFRSAKRKRVQSGPAASVRAYQGLEQAKRELHSWAQLNQVDTVDEAWIATDEGSFGAWVPIEAEPEDLIEHSYPMRFLAPNPDDPDHAAHDGSIYWGPIPTAGDQVTADGSARFNDSHLYQIQVFARANAGDCPGPLSWSAPSEPFRLASFFDGDGCAQRPTEIRLPDFGELEATTAKPSVKFSSPPGSSINALATGEDLDDQGEEICYFFIPLITIVAMFVLNLFLPVIVFLFQLWWMLKLKFCVPPSVQLEAELAAQLDIEPAQFEFEADFDAHVHAGNAVAVAAALKKMFDQDKKHYQKQDDPPPFDPDYEFGNKLLDEFSVDALMKLAVGQGYGRAAQGGAPIFTTNPAHTTAVRFEAVVHP